MRGGMQAGRQAVACRQAGCGMRMHLCIPFIRGKGRRHRKDPVAMGLINKTDRVYRGEGEARAEACGGANLVGWVCGQRV